MPRSSAVARKLATVPASPLLSPWARTSAVALCPFSAASALPANVMPGSPGQAETAPRRSVWFRRPREAEPRHPNLQWGPGVHAGISPHPFNSTPPLPTHATNVCLRLVRALAGADFIFVFKSIPQTYPKQHLR